MTLVPAPGSSQRGIAVPENLLEVRGL
ncbi:MAG: hypothetical protein QOH21_1322, partial [Acidobacteriota bacterium]|nr:hypothetical protein [Acidobacteriota bacterium]